jgi:hypothetical protein
MMTMRSEYECGIRIYGRVAGLVLEISKIAGRQAYVVNEHFRSWELWEYQKDRRRNQMSVVLHFFPLL